MNKFKWGRMNEPDVLIDHYNTRVISIMKIRDVFARLARALIAENKKEKAIEVLDRIIELTPHNQLPYDYFTIPIAELYYKLNETEKANKIINKLAGIYEEDLNYYLSLPKPYSGAVGYETRVAMSVMQELVSLTETHKQDEIFERISTNFDVLFQKYISSEQSKQ